MTLEEKRRLVANHQASGAGPSLEAKRALVASHMNRDEGDVIAEDPAAAGEMALRKGLASGTFGLSEPMISGVKAMGQKAFEGIDPSKPITDYSLGEVGSAIKNKFKDFRWDKPINEQTEDLSERQMADLRMQKKREAEMPVLAGASSAFGSIASPMPIKTMNFLKGASIPKGMLNQFASNMATEVAPMVAGKALEEAISNPDATGESISDMALDPASLAIGTGLAARPFVKGMAGAVRAAPKAMRSKAEELALEAAISPNKSAMDRIRAQPGKVNELGGAILDDLQMSPLDRGTSLNAKAAGKLEEAGDVLDKIYESIPEAKVNPKKVAGILRNSEHMQQLRVTPGAEGQLAAFEKAIKTLETGGIEGVDAITSAPLKSARSVRQGIDKQINYNKKIPDMAGNQESLYKIRSGLADEMLNSADETMAASGKGNRGDLAAANKKASIMSLLEELTAKKAAGEASNRAISLTDTIAAAGGLAGGGGPLAVQTGIANKLVRTYGKQTAAWSLDKTSKALNKVAPKLAKQLDEISPTQRKTFLEGLTKSLNQGREVKAQEE